MRELYSEGLANHTDPESCGLVRKDQVEALTGAHAGRKLSHEIRQSREPTSSLRTEGNIGRAEKARHCQPCVVIEPEHVWNHLAREPGGPESTYLKSERMGRPGKPQGVILGCTDTGSLTGP